MIFNFLSIFYAVGLLILFFLNLIVGNMWEIKDMDDDYTIISKKPQFLIGFTAYTFIFSIFAFPFKWHLLLVFILFGMNAFFIDKKLLDLAQCCFVILLGGGAGFYTYNAYINTRRWDQSLLKE